MIDLRELRDLLVDVISEAERRVINLVGRSFPGAEENTITTLFVGEAEKGLDEATKHGRVAAALLADLKGGYCTDGFFPPDLLHRISDGVVARLRKQMQAEELKTGGDFALLVIQPQFQIHFGGDLALERGGLKQGLLVQAKRRYRDGRWNRLTSRQRELLPRRAGYTALLRYEFLDSNTHLLQRFNWHPLAGRDVSEIDRWLKRGDFPSAVETSTLVASLSRGEFGTADQDIIEREICPDAGRFVVIEVDWPDGEDPKALVESINREVEERAQRREEVVEVQVRS